MEFLSIPSIAMGCPVIQKVVSIQRQMLVNVMTHPFHLVTMFVISMSSSLMMSL